jgi:alpha-beta hydrolase superfamily lysophospholipase
MARLAALLACVILAACAPVTARLGERQTTPMIESASFTTRDGLQLPLRRWESEKPRAVIVALHGMSDYSNAFEMPAAWWATQGITTYAYDQRSFGQSPNSGIWPGGEAMRRDLADCIDAVKARHPGVPIFALGESMGGAVTLSAMAENILPPVDGVILVAPAVWSRSDMPWLYRAALWLTARVAPSMTLTGKGLKIWPSDNIEMLKKLSKDPLFQKKTRADAVWGLVNLMDEGRNAPEKIKNPPPILLLYGANDQIIPRKPTEAVIKELGSKAEVKFYPKGYHMLLRDLEGPAIWKDVQGWVETKTAP